MFAIGVIELTVTLAVALAALGCHVLRLRGRRWVAAAAICLALASVLTPADLASTLIVAAACLACYFGGTRQRPVAKHGAQEFA
jgi:hypothetical protein